MTRSTARHAGAGVHEEDEAAGNLRHPGKHHLPEVIG